ncbi:polymerase [[Actinobacillus] muris]|uniref:Polymerase n=1 Tax=Muribacter muris TaxID=67855 RepID=A0A0J5S2L1_9PAST|nr:WzyE family oligosaccharide polymerase [Muribacter muris]KMK51032.1 polymerase [[Actinobacillus] muris] [Muribacter muris]
MAYGILISLFFVAVVLIGSVIWQGLRQQGQTFHLLFSLIYGVTCFLGVPFSVLLAWQFGQPLPDTAASISALGAALGGYGLYWLGYQGANRIGGKAAYRSTALATKEVQLTACLLMLISTVALALFIGLNEGLLLFKLEKYSQIFSARVKGVPLKRFFYFFIPALLIFFWLKPSLKRWWWGLILGLGFGILSYLAVGGTRANIALVVALFLLLGWRFGYVAKKWLISSACLAVIAMFWLALWRYDLAVSGREAWFTFLYLTRDTFSPWQNFALILASEIDYQGLMPIVRDFYVYIPQAWWADRPDIVWNSANYFTKIVLGNQSGLAMSPTLLGSFYIMGGYPLMACGMLAVGAIIRAFDVVFERVEVLGKAYCLANLFNLVVLVREGADAFVSRWVFFSIVFVLAWQLAKWLGYLARKGGK